MWLFQFWAAGTNKRPPPPTGSKFNQQDFYFLCQHYLCMASGELCCAQTTTVFTRTPGVPSQSDCDMLGPVKTYDNDKIPFLPFLISSPFPNVKTMLTTLHVFACISKAYSRCYYETSVIFTKDLKKGKWDSSHMSPQSMRVNGLGEFKWQITSLSFMWEWLHKEDPEPEYQ